MSKTSYQKKYREMNRNKNIEKLESIDIII